MASTFIPATVIKHNNTVFLGDSLIDYGDVQQIPTPGTGGRIDGDYWATPITDGGVVDSFNFDPVVKENAAVKPDVQSFRVFRLITSKQYGKADYWYILGTTTQYLASSQAAECCDTPVLMPTDTPNIAPTQLMCQYNNATAQDYFAVWGVPTTLPGGRLYAYGFFNNAALPSLASTGYATAALLNAAMQSTWSGIVGGTFVLANNVITLTQPSGPGTDEISINILSVATSSGI